MDRRLFLVLGLSLIVALVISSVFYFQVVGRSSGPKQEATTQRSSDCRQATGCRYNDKAR